VGIEMVGLKVMKLKLVTIGKTKSRHYLAAASDYAERLAHYLPFDMVVADSERSALKKIQPNDFLVACDLSGVQKSSEEMAEFLDHHAMKGTKNLVFFIGGAAGVGEPILKRANERLSLSKMTFPHELAQVIVLEQLYRACAIRKGEPYHK
jgi:23S rRNA (pseudouridine1915-N3)-methyltransferase